MHFTIIKLTRSWRRSKWATPAITTETQTQIQADKDNDLDSGNMCGSVDTCADDTENDEDNDVICDNMDSFSYDNENDKEVCRVRVCRVLV